MSVVIRATNWKGLQPTIFMSVAIRATNWKAGESGSDFCLAETFLLAIVRKGLQPTIFLTIKNGEILIWWLTCLALLLTIHLRQVQKVKNDQSFIFTSLYVILDGVLN
jgi:hypothetical protein